MDSYTPPTEFITRWITDDGQVHVHAIPNIDRMSKWSAIDKMLELMQDSTVIEIGTYRVVLGRELRGNLHEMFEARMQRIGVPLPHWVEQHYNGVDVLGIVKKNEHKMKAVFLP
jgi:hypothetical protein